MSMVHWFKRLTNCELGMHSPVSESVRRLKDTLGEEIFECTPYCGTCGKTLGPPREYWDETGARHPTLSVNQLRNKANDQR